MGRMRFYYFECLYFSYLWLIFNSSPKFGYSLISFIFGTLSSALYSSVSYSICCNEFWTVALILGAGDSCQVICSKWGMRNGRNCMQVIALDRHQYYVVIDNCSRIRSNGRLWGSQGLSTVATYEMCD